LEISDAILENAIEQGTPFSARPVAIPAGELQHRVLDDIQGVRVVADRDACDSIRAPLHIDQKTLEFARLLQTLLLGIRRILLQAYREHQGIRQRHSVSSTALHLSFNA
jgi:hypothetical protein